MKQRIFAAVLVIYIIVFGSLNKTFKSDIYSFQNFFYYTGLGILTYLVFKHTNKDVLNKLPAKIAIYFFIVGCLIIFFAIST